MINDPIVEEIRNYRQEHARKYGNDLNRICAALREREKKSSKKAVTLTPRLLLSRTAG